jgi:hypothetical protein
MAVEPGAIARLSRVIADGTIDAHALNARHDEIAALLSGRKHAPTRSRSELLVLGVNLHAYYTALETLLERVARLVDEELPTGATWHRDLLLQMRLELPGVRPAVLPAETIAELDELRKFRHFFRNAYVLDLDAGKTLGHAERVLRVHVTISGRIAALFQHLEAVVRALAKG